MEVALYAEDQIRAELQSGELVPLPLDQGSERWGTLYLATPDPEAAGPGARRLAGIIRRAVTDSPPTSD